MMILTGAFNTVEMVFVKIRSLSDYDIKYITNCVIE
jgi:hypothetical protein